MEINICHLYADLLNTYADIGNISILKYRCNQRNIKVNIIPISINDQFYSENYDISILCGGQDNEQKIVSEDIKKNKANEIKNYIESGKVLIAICGGFQLLGEYYETLDGEKIECSKILDIYTKADKNRCVGNIIIEDFQTKEKYVGFENHSGRTYLKKGMQPLGNVLYGKGNNAIDGKEGLIYKNTYCTYMHGPLFSKNPNLADRLIKIAISNKYNEDIELKPINDIIENKAKQSIIDRFLDNKKR